MMLLVPLWVVLVSTCALYHGVSGGNNVVTQLQTPWSATPLYMEASELFETVDTSHFWKFVETLASNEKLNPSEEDGYKQSITFAENVLPPILFESFKLSLLARSTSPKVTMFFQVAGDDNALFNMDIDNEEDCPFIVVSNRNGVCNVGDLASLVGDEDARHFDVDHIYGEDDAVKEDGRTTLVLYGDFASKGFLTWHNALKDLHNEGKVAYILRHKIDPRTPQTFSPLMMSGWGVELAVKKTEYTLVDDAEIDDGESVEDGNDEDVDNSIAGFSFSTLKERYPSEREGLDTFRDHLRNTTTILQDLKQWELQDISLQTAEVILGASNPLNVLEKITHNFPTMVGRIVSSGKVRDDFRKEVENNRNALAMYRLESSILTIGSTLVDLENTDFFNIFKLLQREGLSLGSFSSLGISHEAISSIRALQASKGQSDASTVLDLRSDRVLFFNDIENDKKYKSWPTTLRALLQPTRPGQMRFVRHNMYNLVVCGDLSNAQTREMVAQMMNLYEDTSAVRLGVVFYTKEGQLALHNMELSEASSTVFESDHVSLSVLLVRSFEFVKDKKNTMKAFQFLQSLFASHANLNDDELKSKLEAVFTKVYSKEDWHSICAPKSDYDTKRKEMDLFAREIGIANDGHPQVFFNGKELKNPTAANVQSLLLEEMKSVYPQVQRDVYYGMLSDYMNVLDHLMSKSTIVSSLTPSWLSKATSILSQEATSNAVQSFQQHVGYIHMPKMAKKLKSHTVWLFCDLSSKECLYSLKNLLEHLEKDKMMRIGVVHAQQSSELTDGESLAVFISAISSVLSSTKTHTCISNIVKNLLGGAVFSNDLVKAECGDSWSKVKEAFNKQISESLRETFSSLRREMVGPATSITVVLNGEVFVSPTSAFLSSKLIAQLITTNNKRHQSDKLATILFKESTKLGGAIGVSDKVVECTTTLSRTSMQLKKQAEGRLSHQHRVMDVNNFLHTIGTDVSSFSVVSDNCQAQRDRNADEAMCHNVFAMIDPTTEEAQRAASILSLLAEQASVEIMVVLNPTLQVSEMPLKRFYRSVAPSISFSSSSSSSSAPRAYFSNLPTASLLTLGLETPSSWVVQSLYSKYDLDNIHLHHDKPGVVARFSLSALSVTGRCLDPSTSHPVAGLQLELGTKTDGAVVDTIVMANLGYFQLKATPGAWQITLRHGQSEAIYSIEEIHGADKQSSSTDAVVLIYDLSGTHLVVNAVRKPGMENEQLLDSGDGKKEESKGLWDSVKKFVPGTRSSNSDARGDELETINVFSLASGHLYERFLKIMMLSVLKNTKNPVKFWFLEDCMSPQMKAFLPFMAKKHGFKFQLVSYNWPEWLNKPKEKMRLIWAYKILFLDVLFPLDVKKIIFVDADQVVRADLNELVELNLHGAPYGYTPFCSSRKGMGGFRFWESGYWKNHLNGRPYHISALYVVDLVRFRQFAAGDRLREQYQGLSRDPNSLSNLDQDLPNNMVHQVPIYSLPQEWLWCESWCDDTSKKKAKTIDLCNNPKTKEPKLEAAVRIIPEWTALDEEAKATTMEFENRAKGGNPSKAQHDEL
eukprot:m.116958 g.116958  ORF g.116958 m.116958 type:complete len:1554 (-) comp9315_c2_seq1:228-4889(-)